MTQQNRTIASLLEFHADNRPAHPAITAPNYLPLTYAKLYEQVAKNVDALREAGLCNRDRVAVVLPNGADMATTFLSVASFTACAPLNPGYQRQEYEFYLKDLQAKALILQAGVDSPARVAAEENGIKIIELTPCSENVAGVFTLNVSSASKEGTAEFSGLNDVGLILHTSGTTSKPKLVPLTQANLMRSANNVLTALELKSQDRCLNIMPLFHIHGLIGSLLSTISSGGTVICTSGLDTSQLLQWFEIHKPTWYSAVPTLHQAILREVRSSEQISSFKSLRFIRSSSSSLPPTLMNELELTFGIPIIEAYGMTEATHQITSNPTTKGAQKLGSVGLASGPQVGIMDHSGALLPSEQIGEIVIKGENVTSGYENNPAANKTSFTSGWFRTGDQGKIDCEGYLYITGRLKEIINRGGEKISPREIDEALMTHPDIEQAVAFAVPHETLGEDIAAAIVLREGAILSERQVRVFAFDNLIDFKVPSQVLILKAIPKGPTGKLQRIGLAEKIASHFQKDYVAPRNEVEELIAEIVAAVLVIDRVSVHANFFSLGGDSLRATQVMSRLRQAFMIELPIVVTLFRSPTIEELAEVIERSLDSEVLGELLDEIDSISDEEAQKILGS